MILEEAWFADHTLAFDQLKPGNALAVGKAAVAACPCVIDAIGHKWAWRAVGVVCRGAHAIELTSRWAFSSAVDAGVVEREINSVGAQHAHA